MPKKKDEPHAKRGWLKHGNPTGNPAASPRCGAKTRRGTPCIAPGMPNGRCRLHGGASTGPRTPTGLERSRRARWKHGRYSREARIERSRSRAVLHAVRATIRHALQVVR